MKLDDACLGLREENPLNAEPIVLRDHGIFPDASTVLKVGQVLDLGIREGMSVRARVTVVKPGYVEYVPC